MRNISGLFAGVLMVLMLPLFAACEEAKPIDLAALAKKTRKAVYHLVICDKAGKEIGTGTGFAISGDGLLVTCCHVIESADKIIAKSESGGFFPVKGVLSRDSIHDVAILKLDCKEIEFVNLGESESQEAGNRIAVVGSPLGLEGSLSEGIISAVRKDAKLRWLQITAAISPGSSGSPVLNGNGEVVGMAKGTVIKGQSLNIAVPVEDIKNLLNKDKEKEKGKEKPALPAQPAAKEERGTVDAANSPSDNSIKLTTFTLNNGTQIQALRVSSISLNNSTKYSIIKLDGSRDKIPEEDVKQKVETHVEAKDLPASAREYLEKEAQKAALGAAGRRRQDDENAARLKAIASASEQRKNDAKIQAEYDAVVREGTAAWALQQELEASIKKLAIEIASAEADYDSARIALALKSTVPAEEASLKKKMALAAERRASAITDKAKAEADAATNKTKVNALLQKQEELKKQYGVKP